MNLKYFCGCINITVHKLRRHTEIGKDCINLVCVWKHARPLSKGGLRTRVSHCAGSICWGIFSRERGSPSQPSRL